MIDPRELRIGNYILAEIAPDMPRPHKVMPQDIADIAAGKVTLHAIEPVPLTPELLVQCGFIKTDNHIDAYSFELYRKGDFPLWYNNYEPNSVWVVLYDHELGLDSNYKGIKAQTDFEFLHQLQNLYFCITGEELAIDL